MRLTELAIRTLKTPDQGASVFHDDVISGFGVRVSKGGTKSFVITHGPRRERETIGRVGVLSLQDARTEARRRLAEYTLGKTKPRAVSWQDAVQEFLAEIRQKRKKTTHANYECVLRLYFRYGATRFSEITSYELQKSIDVLSDKISMQRRAYVTVRAFVRWAHRRYYLEHNPMDRMKCPGSYIPRGRVLSDDELRKVWQAAGDDTFGRIVKLLILTGQRRGEITGLTGRMVQASTITLPATATKNNREHTIPLGEMAKGILLPLRKQDECYFPALGRTTPFNGHSPCMRRLLKRCDVRDWTLHDLRRTFATGMASLGVPIPVIEKLLNHVSGSFGGIVSVYQRYHYMPEMRHAIDKWEAHVAELVAG